MFIGQAGDAAAARGAGQVAELHQVGLAEVLQRDALLAQRGGQRVKADRAAAVQLDDRAQHAAVELVQALRVNVHLLARRDGDGAVDGAVALHGRKIAHPLEQTVGDARRAAAAARELQRAVMVDGDAENSRAARDDAGQFVRAVGLELEQDAETVAQRTGELPGAGRGADEREARQVDADALGRRAFADHDIEREVLERRVEHLLDLAGQAVDLINKEDVPLLQVGQQRGQVAGLFDGRAGGDAHLHAHLLRDDAGQRCFAKTGRAVQKDMVHRLAALLRRAQIDAQVALDLVLADIIIQRFGAQAVFFCVGGAGVRADEPGRVDGIFLILRHGVPFYVLWMQSGGRFSARHGTARAGRS